MVTIDGETQKTVASERNNAPRWNETFFLWVRVNIYLRLITVWIFNGDASHGHVTSILKLRVFAERTYNKDDYIGEMKEKVRSLLTQDTVDRGHCIPSFPFNEYRIYILAVTRTLSKKDATGALQPMQAKIKFNILEVEGGPEGSTSAVCHDSYLLRESFLCYTGRGLFWCTCTCPWSGTGRNGVRQGSLNNRKQRHWLLSI